MPYYNNNSYPLFYQIRGSGPPLLFIHGYRGSSWKHWHYQLKENILISKYQLIALDIRGFGLSYDKKRKLVNTEDVISDIHVLLTKELQLNSSPVIIGYSIGAVLSLAYTLLFPNNVKGLILVSPIPLLSATITSHEPYKDKILFNKRLNSLKDVSWNILKFMYSQLLNRRFKRLEQNPDKFISRMKKINQPILMVYGTRDSVVPKRGFELMISHLPNHSYIIQLPYDHGISHEHPEIFNKIIINFCSRIQIKH